MEIVYINRGYLTLVGTDSYPQIPICSIFLLTTLTFLSPYRNRIRTMSHHISPYPYHIRIVFHSYKTYVLIPHLSYTNYSQLLPIPTYSYLFMPFTSYLSLFRYLFHITVVIPMYSICTLYVPLCILYLSCICAVYVLYMCYII